MPTAFTGGPYFVTEFVPSTAGNIVQDLADCVNAAGWKLVESVSAYATGTIIQPTDGTTVTLDGIIYTFKNTPTLSHHVQIGPSAIDTASNFVVKVDSTSATINAAFDGSNVVTLSYAHGGAAGNGISVSGWITWTSSGPTNQLWGGGYKFRTGFPGCVPCIVYIHDSHFSLVGSFDMADVQFMSADQGIQGTTHHVRCGSLMRFVGSSAQFFLYNKDVLTQSEGSFVCGGSFFTPADPLPSNAWYSFGDCVNNVFSSGASPRTFIGFSTTLGSSECCFGEAYCQPGASSTRGTTRLTIYSTTDDQFEVSSVAQPPRWIGGDPWVSEPFLVCGDDNTPTTSPLRIRGQLFDAIVVGQAFATQYTGTSLAAAYPWSDGSTRSDGFPRNRLSADFDNVAQWENITDNFVYGGLFVASAEFVVLKKANFVY